MAYTGQNPKFNSTVLKDIGVSSIANPASGSHRIINRAGALFVQDPAGLETGIGAGGTVDKVTQVGHGFDEGDVLYYTGSAYAKAKADTSATAEVVGMVSRVIDVDTFEITLEGKVTGLTGLTAGEVYFLSPTVSGAITATEPSVLGHVSLPIGVAISATVIYVRSSRGAVVGSSNARTEIALANNAVTNVQSVAAYQAGELTGWVEIDGTTDLKFYVSAPFAKNGAATDFNISPQYVGDTPPVGFSMSVTSGGIIQATLPSIAGYVSAKINFALNAPAVGATFPLSIDSTLVQFSTLKAKDAGGFIFQENGGTQIGSWTDAGALTVGPTSGAQHTANINNSTSFKFNAPAGNGVNLEHIADNTVPTRVIFNTANYSWRAGTLSSNTEIGLVSSTGAWTIGAASTQLTHTIYGAISFGYENSTFPTNGHIWRDTSDQMRFNASGGYVFSNDTNATNYGTMGSSGWNINHTGNKDTADTTHYGLLRVEGNNPAGTNGQVRIYRSTATATHTLFNGLSDVGSSSTQVWRVECDGDTISTTGSYTSDERAKKDIEPIPYGLAELMQLQPISFRWNHEDETETKSFSVATAQEVQAIMPEMVRDDGLECVDAQGEKFQAKSLYAGEVMAVMVKAIQELSAKVTALEAK